MKWLAHLMLAVAITVACEDATQPEPDFTSPLRLTQVANVTFQELGTLGGGFSLAHDVNEVGQVVGISETGTGEFHAFLWTEVTGMIDLGTLGGSFSRATAINNLGQIAGSAANASGIRRAFLWTAVDGMEDLGSLGGGSSTASDINEIGEIVGQTGIAPGESHAFVWSDAVGMTDLGTFAGPSSRAAAINLLGQVVGSSSYIDGQVLPQRALVWTQTEGPVSLGILGGDFSRADGLNDVGQIVGGRTTAAGQDQNDLVAVLWNTDRGLVDLGTLPGDAFSIATDVNNLGIVTGSSYNDPLFDTRAILWTEELGMVQLDGLDGTIDVAARITNVVGDRVLIAGGSSPTTDPFDLKAVVWSVELVPPEPEEVTQQVTDGVVNYVATGTLAEGEGNALMATLDATTRQLNRGNEEAAGRLIEAFIRQVEAYVRAGILSPEEGQVLIDMAENSLAQM